MPYVLGLDLETTFTDPVDPKKARITEIGAVLWEPRTQMPDLIMSRFVWDSTDSDYKYDPRMLELCGIGQEPLTTFGIHPRLALTGLLSLIKKAEAIVAHNGNLFDRPVLEAEFARHNLALPDKMWVDTTIDLPFPKSIETRKLKYLAFEHGFVNPFPHRALFDVLSMLRVMSSYDFDAVLARAQEPTLVLRAIVPKPFGPGNDGGAGVAAAKAAGFRFDGDRKWWIRSVKESDILAITNALPSYTLDVVDL